MNVYRPRRATVYGSRFTADRLRLVGGLAVILSLSACGSVGEPLPPLLNIPERSQDLSARQTPEGVVLEWTWPRFTTEGMPLKDLDTFAVHRLQINHPSESVSGERFERESRFVSSLEGSELDAYGPGEKVRLRLPAEGMVGKTFVFGVRAASRRGRSVGFSNLVTIEILEVPEAPGKPALTVREDGVLVEWRPGKQATSYEILRRSGEDNNFAPLGQSEATRFLDSAVEWAKTYEYRVRSMRRSSTGEIQGHASEVASAIPTDMFPPATPSEVRAVASESRVELSWKPNTDMDLAGYRILRREGEESLRALHDGLVSNPSYSDSSVESAHTYHYAVIAVDRKGNESAPSEPAAVRVR